MEKIEPGRLEELLKAFKRRKLLVVGDLILDEYVWGEVDRISPEAPVPVVLVKSKTYRLGGATNVANNVRSLEGTTIVAGLVGRDLAAKKLLRRLREAHILTDGVFKVPERPTTVKSRIIARNQQIIRIDEEESNHVDPRGIDSLLGYVAGAIGDVDGMILSDYGKGLFSREMVKELIGLARRHDLIVTVDPKEDHFDLYEGASLVTPNQTEAEGAVGMSLTDRDSLISGGQALREKIGCRALLITRGSEGMSLFQDDGVVYHGPTRARQVYDVTGAGDTVIAAATLALAAGAGYREAVTIANHAAGVVVGKLGTSQATPQEIRKSMEYASG
jgi:D-beta-D-heptose 7-phosphate kinase/D-beta-D-heptose 1-phosphate adenosyltransferase